MQNNNPVRLIRWVLIGIGLIILVQAILIIAGTGEQFRLVMMDLAIGPIGMVSTVILAYTAWQARAHSPRLATIWGITAVAVLFWTLGDLTWALLEVFLKIEPFPSIADFLYLLYYPISILALAHLPSQERSGREKIRLAMDIAIVFISVGVIYWAFIIGPIYQDADFSSLEWVISLAYPVLDLAVLFGLILIIIRPYERVNNGPFLFLAVSMIIQVLCDTIYTRQTAMETFQTGTFLDLGWQIGLYTYAIAAFILLKNLANPELVGKQFGQRAEQILRNRVWPLLPYLWMMAAYAMLAWSLANPLALSPQQIVPWIGIIFFLVVGRQLLMIAENTRLSNELRGELIERVQMNQTLDRRAREMAALYDISIEINSQLDIPILLRSILRRAAELLEAPMGALFLPRPDGISVRMEVNYNLPAKFEGLVMPLGEGFAGTIAQTSRPLAIEDFSAWRGISPLVSDLSLRRMVGVPLKLGGNLKGVILILDDRRTGEYSESDVLLLSLFADQAAIALENARLYQNAQQEIMERRRIEAELQRSNDSLEQRVDQRTQELSQTNTQLRASLSEKEMLLKEIHHRVKNNLQVISSLLSLQMGQQADAPTLEALRESQNRVRSMALIHEKIYQSKDLSRVDFGEYIHSLAQYLFGSYRANTDQVKLTIEVDPVALGVDAAVPCGLILNELISNALKHAFPNRRNGEICISMKRLDGEIFLQIQDDGVGFPQGMEIEDTPSLGLQLVTTLVSQLDGTLELSRQPGTRFIIRFSA
jgi:two-component system, sensor histidine kinase PdtaS